jgi:hypothetical protein
LILGHLVLTECDGAGEGADYDEKCRSKHGLQSIAKWLSMGRHKDEPVAINTNPTRILSERPLKDAEPH